MKKPEIDFLVEYDDESILAEVRCIAKATGSNTVTKGDLRQIGRVSHSAVVRRFGSLRQALSLAGLKSGRFMKATDEELLAIINHRFPFAEGGSDHLTNLETLCYECNRGQRDSVV